MLLNGFRQRPEVGRWCIGHFVNDQAVILVGLVHLWKISGIQLLIRSFDELKLANRIVVGHIFNTILLQQPKYFPRIPALKKLSIDLVAITRILSG